MNNITQELEKLLTSNLDVNTNLWIQEKLHLITASVSAKDLYLTYSLLANKIGDAELISLDIENIELKKYLKIQQASILQIARIYVLIKVLEQNAEYFQPKVANLIQVADTSELETFLKYLILLPNSVFYKATAVDALRTNIATVFNAIALNNPYPEKCFNEQEWNQMYLKTIFIQQDLSQIIGVDERANKDLARIISDYAHERWAASRKIDPLFWRPVANFIAGNLLLDMEQLLASDDPLENKAGALCCYNSDKLEAKNLLNQYAILKSQVIENEVTWENLKQ